MTFAKSSRNLRGNLRDGSSDHQTIRPSDHQTISETVATDVASPSALKRKPPKPKTDDSHLLEDLIEYWKSQGGSRDLVFGIQWRKRLAWAVREYGEEKVRAALRGIFKDKVDGCQRTNRNPVRVQGSGSSREAREARRHRSPKVRRHRWPST